MRLPGPVRAQSADYQEAAKVRTKTGLKSFVSLILDRIAEAYRGPNKSVLNQGWIRRQCFAIRLKPEFCWKIDVDTRKPTQSRNLKGRQCRAEY